MRSLTDSSLTLEFPELIRQQRTQQGHPVALSISHDLALASTLQTASETLTILALRHNPEVRAAVAIHPSTSDVTLHTLASDPDWVVLSALVRHPRTLPDDLVRIADRAWSPPPFPSSFFTHLTTAVKMGLVQNPHFPEAVLTAYLAHESDPTLLAFAAARSASAKAEAQSSMAYNLPA